MSDVSRYMLSIENLSVISSIILDIVPGCRDKQADDLLGSSPVGVASTVELHYSASIRVGLKVTSQDSKSESNYC